MANTKRIYTVGHSNRNIEEPLRLIKKYNIKVVVDVRRFPKSARYPHFNKEVLDQTLRKHGISYIWLGKLLGGYRSGGYQEYMKTREYRKGINELIRIVEMLNEGYVAIMCSEKLWFKCHRRFIADTLSLKGYEVIHIVEHDRAYKHKAKNIDEDTRKGYDEPSGDLH